MIDVRGQGFKIWKHDPTLIFFKVSKEGMKPKTRDLYNSCIDTI